MPCQLSFTGQYLAWIWFCVCVFESNCMPLMVICTDKWKPFHLWYMLTQPTTPWLTQNFCLLPGAVIVLWFEVDKNKDLIGDGHKTRRESHTVCRFPVWQGWFQTIPHATFWWQYSHFGRIMFYTPFQTNSLDAFSKICFLRSCLKSWRRQQPQMSYLWNVLHFEIPTFPFFRR